MSTTMLTCAIIDDEPLAVQLLESYVKKTPYLELVRTFGNAVEAADVLKDNPVDLLFLDIQMPDMNGLEFARFMPSRARIVYTTAFGQYAVESYRVDALDYLLKPVGYSDFLAAAERAKAWFGLQDAAHAPAARQNNGTPQPSMDSVFVKSEYKVIRIRVQDILYVEGLKDYIKIYTATQPKPILSLTSMHGIADSLPSTQFLRIHRSYIVNMEQVSHLERGQIVFGDKLLPVSESNREKVQAYINARMISK